MKRSCLVALSAAFLFAGSLLPAQDSELRPDSGVINGRRYMNGYFGFSYRFPEGWMGNAARQRTIAVRQMVPLFSANPQGSDVRYLSINADFLPQNSTIKSPKEFLELAAQTVSQAFEPLHTDKRCVFAGKQFYRIDMKSRMVPGAPVVYQTQITTFLRSYAVTFSFMASNSDDMAELVRTMESLGFFEPGELPAVPGTQVQVAEKSEGHPRSEAKPTAAPAAPVQITSATPIAAPANVTPSNAEPKNVELQTVQPRNVEPVPAFSAPIATLAAKPEPASNAVQVPSARQSRPTASQATEHPVVANSFVTSAPRVQTMSPPPATPVPGSTVEARMASAKEKGAATPAKQASPAMTATTVSEPAITPAAAATPAQPVETASGAPVHSSPGQAQVTTVSSNLPDRIQPLAAPVIPASAIPVSPASAKSGGSFGTMAESAPAKSATIASSGAATATTQKKAAYIPSSLASPPAAALPERVSVVSEDAPAHTAVSQTPPSTLIQATRRPSDGSATSGPATPVTTSEPNQHSSASGQPAAAAAPSTAMAPPRADPAATSSEPKAVSGVTTVAMNTPPAPIATTAKPSRVQVSTAELEANLTRKTLPVYPMVARNFKVEGLVVVDVVVDRNGNVLEAKALSGPQLLLRGAEAAVRQWHFKPYLVDGAPVEMESQVSLNYRLSR